MKRYFIIFKGRVQGVGFRYFVYEEANKLNLKGFVRNLSNGNVEAEIEGNPSDFQMLLHRILQNNHFINVEDYSIKEIDLKESENKFSIYS